MTHRASKLKGLGPLGTLAARSRRAFTLIELLVVIAIIAILAAILFPVFAQAREAARRTQCLSNQKNLATALIMYAQDYDECIMPWKTGPGETLTQRLWTARIQPYLRNGSVNPPTGVFVCPSWSQQALSTGVDAPSCDGPGYSSQIFPVDAVYANYGIAAPMPGAAGTGADANNAIVHIPGSGYINKKFPWVQVALPQIIRSADTAIISDGATLVKGTASIILFGCEGAAMHQGGENMVMLDGHAKWIKGNAQSYVVQGSNGLWYQRYFAYDQE